MGPRSLRKGCWPAGFGVSKLREGAHGVGTQTSEPGRCWPASVFWVGGDEAGSVDVRKTANWIQLLL